MNSVTRLLHYLVLTAMLAFSLAAAAAPGNRLVLQISDDNPVLWNQAFNNARNVQAILGKDNVAIQVVVYGHGIKSVMAESTIASRVAETLALGIPIVVCEQTMKGRKLTRDDLLPDLGYVPAGVVELMQKQQQGWAYVKP